MAEVVGLKPNQLARRITEIIAEECKCEAAWYQHPGPLTTAEITEIMSRIIFYVHDLLP